MRSRVIIGVAVVAALIAAGFAVVFFLVPSPADDPLGPPPSSTASYPAPSETPIPEGPPESTPNPAPTDGRMPADVAVTYSGWNGSGVEVSAFVTNVIEDGGSCSATVSGAGGTAEASVTADAGPSTTDCPTFVVPGADLAAGSYTLTVSYSSTGYAGSTTTTVEVTK